MNTQLETFDDLEKDINKNYSITNTIEDLDIKDVNYNEEIVDNVVEGVSSSELDEIKSFFANKEE